MSDLDDSVIDPDEDLPDDPYPEDDDDDLPEDHVTDPLYGDEDQEDDEV